MARAGSTRLAISEAGARQAGLPPGLRAVSSTWLVTVLVSMNMEREATYVAARMIPPRPLDLPARCPMRVTCFLIMGILVSGAAAAQQSTTPATKSPEDIQAIKERVADWLKTCLADWDRATHMTTNEWRTACNRVAAEREKFLLGDPAEAMSQRTAKPSIKLSAPTPPATHKVAIQVNQNDRAVMDLALNNAKNVIDYYRDKGEAVAIEIVTFGPVCTCCVRTRAR